VEEKEFNWGVVAKNPLKDRYLLLSDRLTSKGITNKVDFFSPDPEELKKELIKAQEGRQALRIQPPYQTLVMEYVNYIPSNPLVLEAADTLLYDKGLWWPQFHLTEAYRQLFDKKVQNLDISANAIVIGTGGQAWATVSSLIQLGFRKISVTSKDDRASSDFVANLERTHFNFQFKAIPKNRISFLPGNHSVVVNCIRGLNEGDLLEDLCNFNYLLKGGVVADLDIFPIVTPLLKIAKDVTDQVIFGYEAAAFADQEWAKATVGLDLGSGYEESLRGCLEDGQG
jgi:shikimate 5-dehydrogenase